MSTSAPTPPSPKPSSGGWHELSDNGRQRWTNSTQRTRRRHWRKFPSVHVIALRAAVKRSGLRIIEFEHEIGDGDKATGVQFIDVLAEYAPGKRVLFDSEARRTPPRGKKKAGISAKKKASMLKKRLWLSRHPELPCLFVTTDHGDELLMLIRKFVAGLKKQDKEKDP